MQKPTYEEVRVALEVDTGLSEVLSKNIRQLIQIISSNEALPDNPGDARFAQWQNSRLDRTAHRLLDNDPTVPLWEMTAEEAEHLTSDIDDDPATAKVTSELVQRMTDEKSLSPENHRLVYRMTWKRVLAIIAAARSRGCSVAELPRTIEVYYEVTKQVTTKDQLKTMMLGLVSKFFNVETWLNFMISQALEAVGDVSAEEENDLREELTTQIQIQLSEITAPINQALMAQIDMYWPEPPTTLN